MSDFLDTWSAASSEGIFGALFPILDTAGSWAGAVADLMGLL
ncbi:PorA family porin [Corynebacterium sp. A21]